MQKEKTEESHNPPNQQAPPQIIIIQQPPENYVIGKPGMIEDLKYDQIEVKGRQILNAYKR